MKISELSSKTRALLTAYVAGVSAFIAWLMTVPPEQQTALLLPLIQLCPIHLRDALGLGMRVLATVSTIYAVYKAAQAGPQTPPKNPPS